MIESASYYYDERVRLDPDKLTALYVQLGAAGAENVVCRAMEELAIRMADLPGLLRSGDYVKLGKTARSLVGIADQIGMGSLARVARDVSDCAHREDLPALAATLARLGRIGDRSLAAIWDMRDMSV